MPRIGRQTAPVIAAAVCVSSLPFMLVGELPGERWLSANDDLLACGSGNLIYAGALAFNGEQLVPEALIGLGLLLPMLLPVVAWLIWRMVRRVTHRGG